MGGDVLCLFDLVSRGVCDAIDVCLKETETGCGVVLLPFFEEDVRMLSLAELDVQIVNLLNSL